MQPLRVFSVTPKLPPELEPLWTLAHNLWFAWNANIEHLFSQIDQRLWIQSRRNPVWFLNHAPQGMLHNLASDQVYIQRVREEAENLSRYLNNPITAVQFPEIEPGQPAVAYFSLEYGITPCLPIYSGGLGILAGDHLKSASDLNIPLVGIGLCYQEGYFRQYLTPDGWQQEDYPVSDFEQLPFSPVEDAPGRRLKISVDLGGRPLTAQIWRANVGRVKLYLLDANVPENPPHFRQITSRLYGGGIEMRIWQEILLGIGGVKALRALNLEPKVIHMNEGHSAFAGLERIREFMTEHRLSFEAAAEMTASSSVFTTHTPVPAGNDRFSPELMHRYFEKYARDMGLAFKVFLALGREDPRDEDEPFCMTVLALRLSRFINGVSTLHGHVSRNMWQRIWPQYPVEDVPIGALTNGVHIPTWVSADMAMLFDRYLGMNWREDPDCGRVWALADSISDAELWRTHERLRARLVDYARMRLREQLRSQGARRAEQEIADEVLDPDALTIGFARRFATYKRANLLLLDKDRLRRIIANNEKPIQFIIAGKAHPADNEGKKLIQELIDFSRLPECRLKMVFIENYDIEIAQYLVQGCDIWLNNPRRPLEACGTSGMKAMANGVLNFSTLDGWWDEAYEPDNSVGWAIGRGEEYADESYQDFVESRTLYNILENDIIPAFYDRSQSDMPRSWVRRMKKALRELGPVYNSHRMVFDYARLTYRPATENHDRLRATSFKAARELSNWRMEMMTKWNFLEIRNVKSEQDERVNVGDPVFVEAEVMLNGIAEDDVSVEIYYGPVNQKGTFSHRTTVEMTPGKTTAEGWRAYTGSVEPVEAGRFGFTVRILPKHPLLLDPHSLGLIKWA